MTSAILQFAPLIVGPMNSVWPAAHIAYKDGKWVELANDPVCIATFAQDQIGDECARLLAAAPDMMAALKVASDALAGTLKARGYRPGTDISVWAPEVQAELRALVAVRAAIAKAEGRANG